MTTTERPMPRGMERTRRRLRFRTMRPDTRERAETLSSTSSRHGTRQTTVTRRPFRNRVLNLSLRAGRPAKLYPGPPRRGAPMPLPGLVGRGAGDGAAVILTDLFTALAMPESSRTRRATAWVPGVENVLAAVLAAPSSYAPSPSRSQACEAMRPSGSLEVELKLTRCPTTGA